MDGSKSRIYITDIFVIYQKSLKLVFFNVRVFKAVDTPNFITCFYKLMMVCTGCNTCLLFKMCSVYLNFRLIDCMFIYIYMML
jgi:hypothetical protein